VKFLGVGEKVDQLEVFHPDRMAQRILGMGDVVGLVEKAAQEIDEKEAMGMMRRMEENKFDLTDMLKQLNFMKKLGPLEGLMGMIPGMSKLKNMPGVDDKRMKHTEALILSMTPKERRNPGIINGSRRKRIAQGSGRPVMEVNQLLKQFEMMKQMMSNKGAMAQMAGGLFGGGGGMPQLPKGMMPGKMPKSKFGKGFRLGG
jgi:signal recognition particle subunit SRP54